MHVLRKGGDEATPLVWDELSWDLGDMPICRCQAKAGFWELCCFSGINTNYAVLEALLLLENPQVNTLGPPSISPFPGPSGWGDSRTWNYFLLFADSQFSALGIAWS